MPVKGDTILDPKITVGAFRLHMYTFATDLALTAPREILQRYVPKWVWFIFNVTFISFIQSVLLFSFSGVPAYAILVSTQHQPNVTAGDLLFFGVEVGLVVSEWFSDGQQWGKRNSDLDTLI